MAQVTTEVICRPTVGAVFGEGQRVPPYVLAQECHQGLRMQRAATQREAWMIRTAWRAGDYHYWPGEFRPIGAWA